MNSTVFLSDLSKKVVARLNGFLEVREKEFSCTPCKYLGVSGVLDSLTIEMISMYGYGFTGNYISSTTKAFYRAHACKAVLVLPKTDDFLGVFMPPTNTFNFSTRPGHPHPDCYNASLGYGLKGDSSTFWHLPRLSFDIIFEHDYNMENNIVDSCIQHYLGICEPHFCSQFPDLKNTLVAHIRNHRDSYPENFAAPGSSLYGQPPLSYYLKAFSFAGWDNILLVGQSTPAANPIWVMFKLLHKTGVLRQNIEFVSGEWKDDFRLLLCAKNIVMSKSTLSVPIRLGRADRFFSFSCFQPLESRSEVFRIEIGSNYTPISHYKNTAEQWAESLLHRVLDPIRC